MRSVQQNIKITSVFISRRGEELHNREDNVMSLLELIGPQASVMPITGTFLSPYATLPVAIKFAAGTFFGDREFEIQRNVLLNLE